MQSINPKTEVPRTEWYHSLEKKNRKTSGTVHGFEQKYIYLYKCVCLIYDLVVTKQEYKNIISVFAYLLATYSTSKNKI